jgi:hypothetical protein
VTITTRMPREQYVAIDALNFSRLKEMKRSPQHYQHALTNRDKSSPLMVGTAAHVAILEPEKYAGQFVVWDRVSENGNSCPRRGQYWDAFQATVGNRTVLSVEEDRVARAIAKAVRFDETANEYLATGEPEVTLQWQLPRELGGRPAKARADWLTTIGTRDCLVGVKTARDCGPFWFGRHAFDLQYHLQWAYYFDAYKAIRGRAPSMVEIVVENEAPHAVAVYRVSDDILELGRETYWELVKQLNECEATNEWPGPVRGVAELSFPTWAYPRESDLSGLGLEAA